MCAELPPLVKVSAMLNLFLQNEAGQGTLYRVRGTDSGYVLSKVDGTSYVVNSSNGRCSCPGARYGRGKKNGRGKKSCKHVNGLRQLGLLREQPTTNPARSMGKLLEEQGETQAADDMQE